MKPEAKIDTVAKKSDMPKLIMIHYPRTLHRSNLAISRTFASAPACQPARVGLTKPSGPGFRPRLVRFRFDFFPPFSVSLWFFRWPQLCHHETLVACFCKLINISDPKHTSGPASVPCGTTFTGNSPFTYLRAKRPFSFWLSLVLP